MKIKMYKSDKGRDGYKLIAETRDEKLILGSFRNGAFFTDGMFKYNGYYSKGQDKEANLVSAVRFYHKTTPEEVKLKWDKLNSDEIITKEKAGKALKSIIDDFDKCHAECDIALDTKNNPDLVKNNIIYPSLDECILDEQIRLVQSSYECIHRKEYTPTKELINSTLMTLGSYGHFVILECEDKKMGEDILEKVESWGYFQQNPGIILKNAEKLKKEIPDNDYLDNIIRLSDMILKDFKEYSGDEQSQEKDLRKVIEFWRELTLFYRIGNNHIDKKFSRGNPFHREIFNKGVDKLIDTVFCEVK